MNTEHGAEDIRTFSKGANSDKEKELLGAKDNGEYIKSRNARNYSVDGNTDALEKIKGEGVIYPRAGLSASYVCIGVAKIKDDVIEFWASPVGGELDTIRVQGTVVASSDALKFEDDRNLQLDTNDKCDGGEVFITDNFTVPLIFNIGDMLSSVGTQKYFTDFNRKLYEINLSTPVDKPVFTKLVTVGGGGGLPVGQYSYSIRYVNEAGDRTNLSPSTPLIPVTQTNGAASPEYPGTKTTGSSSNVSAVTAFGIELKFRVTNELEYDSIEVVRYAWNAGTQLGFSPDPKIIGRVNVSGITVGVITFVDPVNSNIEESIPEDELSNQLMFIERAKAIRYFDKRLVLMNYSLAERKFEPEFTERNNEVMFPIMDAMGQEGHNDAHNHTYKKSYPSGEIFGFAINAYDGVSAKAFAVPIDGFGNFQFPNRRDEIVTGSNSDVYSSGSVTAANTAGFVTKTFEAFDIEDAKGKDDICTFKSILSSTNNGTIIGTKPESDVTEFCADDPELNGANVGIGRVAAPYSVYHPIGDDDPRTEGHNYRSTVEVNDGVLNFGYNPDIFGLNYFSKGIALNGVAKSSIPDWVKSFTVVRTERADRVVCQGLGMYSMSPAVRGALGSYDQLASKDRDKFWFYSPDIDEGVVGQSILDDMKINPNNYKLEFVSPLGFASELYSFDSDLTDIDRQCDLMTYARVLKDGPSVGRYINPNESLTMGEGGYTAYNRYRNSENANGDFFSTPDGGNRLAQLTEFEEVIEGRGSYFSLKTQEAIYHHSTTTGENDFSQDGMKDWTEPFYIINIIQEGASIVDQNIDQYKDTGAYVKMESVIANSSVGANPSIELIDERWEDCIPALAFGDPNYLEERFVYMRDAAGNDLPWYNVTYLSVAQVNIIVNDININGYHTLPSTIKVYGVYSHNVVSDTEIFIELKTGSFTSIPVGSVLLTKYDENAPIKIFGGDTTVGDTIFAPIDRQVNMTKFSYWDATPFTDTVLGEDVNKGFNFNVGFPFRDYGMNPRHYIVKDTKSNLFDYVQNENTGTLGYLRQLCVSFTVESKIATHFAYNENYPNEFFPNTHYVMRPNLYDPTEFATGVEEGYEDNNIHPQYQKDYGDEYLNWDYGGIRFKQNHNIDYSQQSPIDFVSKPDFGFKEETEFCTGVAWSLPRSITQQDSPGLKTFQSLNVVVLEDAQGQINMAYDAQTKKGSNIYALLERGVCLLLHKKSILSDTTGAEIGLFTGNNFIQGEYWLDRNIGSNEDMWRGAAEGSISLKRTSATGKEDGEQERIESLIFSNDMSVYRLVNNEIKDIGRDSYYTEIRKSLKGVSSDQTSRVTAYYDEDYNEFLIQLQYQDPDVTGFSLIEDSFVYSFNSAAWVSNFDYRYDKYLSIKDKLFGMREGQTYELNKGTKINGNPIEFEVEQVTSVAPQKEKEYIKINVNSDNKPTRVEFKDIKNNTLCALDLGLQGPHYLKKYDGFTQQIPRKDAVVSATRDRIQDRLLIYKIFHNLEEDFVVKNVVITFKAIK